MRISLVVIGLSSLAGCAVHEVQHGPPLDAHCRWALLPVTNHAETPEAGARAQSILETLLRVRGIADLRTPPPTPPRGAGGPGDAVFDTLEDDRRLDDAIENAKAAGFTYGVTGSVEEWRYRSGADGEPAVGVSVRVIELATGQTLFSASGARSGWGRETVSGDAQILLKRLLAELSLK